VTRRPGRPGHLRLVDGPAPAARPAKGASVVTYTNRHGEPYYLHEGRTKTGKAKYVVAKAVGNGALGAMPAGFEITESINGVVSVRKADAACRQVPASDLETVRAEIARHLRRYVVDTRDGEIFIHEPEGHYDPEGIRQMAAELAVSVERMRQASMRGGPGTRRS